MSTSPAHRTSGATESKLMSGAKILLECLVREKVDCIFGYPGGVTLPLYDAMYDHPDPARPGPARAERRVRGRRLRARHRQGRRVLRDLGTGRDQSGHRPGRRHDGFDPGRRHHRPGHHQADRQRRVPGSRHVRHHALLHQAQFPGEERWRICRRAIHEAFLHRRQRPARARCWSISPRMCSRPRRTTRRSRSIHLPGYKVYTEGHAGQIRRAAQMIWEAKRPFVYAGGGIIAADASDELRELVETARCPGRQHADGPGRAARRAIRISSACRACTAATPPTWG